MTHFGSNYGTPGWQRAQRKKLWRGWVEDKGASDFDPDQIPPPRMNLDGTRAAARS